MWCGGMAGGSVTAAFCLRMGFFPVGAGRVRTRQRCMCAGAHGPLAAIGDPKYAWNPDGLVARRISVLLREGINCLCVLAALDLIAGVILCPRNRPGCNLEKEHVARDPQWLPEDIETWQLMGGEQAIRSRRYLRRLTLYSSVGGAKGAWKPRWDHSIRHYHFVFSYGD